MANGTQMMMEAAIKLLLSHLKLDPEQVKSKVAEITQIVAEHQGTQNRIVSDLALIKAHLGISTEDDDGRNHQALGGAGELGQVANRPG